MDSKVIFLVIGVFLIFTGAFFGMSANIDPIAKAGASAGFAIAGSVTFIASALAPRKD